MWLIMFCCNNTYLTVSFIYFYTPKQLYYVIPNIGPAVCPLVAIHCLMLRGILK